MSNLVVECLEDRWLLDGSGTGAALLPLLDLEQPEHSEIRTEQHGQTGIADWHGTFDEPSGGEATSQPSDELKAEEQSQGKDKSGKDGAMPASEQEQEATETDRVLPISESSGDDSSTIPAISSSGPSGNSGSSAESSESSEHGPSLTAGDGLPDTRDEHENPLSAPASSEAENESENETHNVNGGNGGNPQSQNDDPPVPTLSDDSAKSPPSADAGSGATETSASANSGAHAVDALATVHSVQATEGRAASETALALASSEHTSQSAEAVQAASLMAHSTAASPSAGDRSLPAQEMGNAGFPMAQSNSPEPGAVQQLSQESGAPTAGQQEQPRAAEAPKAVDPQAADVVFMSFDLGGLGQTLNDLLQAAEGKAAEWLPEPGSREFWLWMAGFTAGTGALAAAWCLCPRGREQQREALKHLLSWKQAAL